MLMILKPSLQCKAPESFPSTLKLTDEFIHSVNTLHCDPVVMPRKNCFNPLTLKLVIASMWTIISQKFMQEFLLYSSWKTTFQIHITHKHLLFQYVLHTSNFNKGNNMGEWIMYCISQLLVE
jgi:hypothetical protein